MLPLIFEIVTRERKLKYSLAESALLLLIAGAVLVHPAYNLVRRGVCDPITASGGASVGLHLRHFYVWFLDPDIGLFPNYPLAMLAVVVFLAARKNEGVLVRRRYLLFSTAFVVINLLAQSSTANLNSGATPGVARYALWYLCLLFFPVLLSMQWIGRLSWARRSVVLSLVLVLCVANISASWPGKPERYTQPSFFSRTLQTSLPFLYDPPAEIFAERFGGRGEALPKDLLAVVGPDCGKILVYEGETRGVILGANGCGYDLTKLALFLGSETRRAKHAETYYLTLGAAERNAVAKQSVP